MTLTLKNLKVFVKKTIFIAAASLNQPNFSNWTPLKPGSFSSSSNSSATPNENNNTLDDKLSKQNVKYDISTGKVYEELGPCSGNSAGNARNEHASTVSTTTRPTSMDYYGQQSYQSASYPYGSYMSSFGAPYGPTPPSYPYDRTSMYSYGAGPKAFVPHSAINLSVKTPELPDSASTLDLSMTEQSQQQTSAVQAAAAAAAAQAAGSQFSSYGSGSAQNNGSSPQILDLTRQEAKKEQKQEQTEPVDFSSNTSAYTYTTTSASTMVAGSFSTSESGNSSTTDTLNRYRSNPVAGYSSLGLSSTGPSGYSTYSSGYASYPQASYSGYSSTFGMNPAAAAGYDQDPLNSYGFVSGLTAAAAAISASSGGTGELPLKTDLLPSVSR